MKVFDYIPGFRSKHKGKMMVALGYYISVILSSIGHPALFFICLSFPFLFFGIRDHLKNIKSINFSKENNSYITMVIIGICFFIASFIMPNENVIDLARNQILLARIEDSEHEVLPINSGDLNSSITIKEKKYDDISYFDIRNDFENMTEQQFNKKYEPYIGRYIVWEGYVREVKEDNAVLIEMDSLDEVFSIFDVRFYLDESESMKLNKDQKIRFEGSIEEIQTLLSSLYVKLNDVIILETIEAKYSQELQDDITNLIEYFDGAVEDVSPISSWADVKIVIDREVWDIANDDDKEKVIEVLSREFLKVLIKHKDVTEVITDKNKYVTFIHYDSYNNKIAKCVKYSETENSQNTIEIFK